jgi:catechol 2,3-dioxygenase-like lactoylglutathione lyase family enzyme
MSIKIGSIVIYCDNWAPTYAFWQDALGYVPRDPPEDGFGILRDPAGLGPELTVERREQTRTGKRSRIHLDLYTDDQPGEVERLLGLGATRYPWRYAPGSDYVVLADPDDNLFCVINTNAHGA